MEIVKENWHKNINELNCHLHPLDTVATKVRSAMKKGQDSLQIKGNVLGSDCVAANVIIQLNKLRFKDSKGDPKGFRLFLIEEKLGTGLLPRYRGNRLHVLFLIGSILTHHFDKFVKYLQKGTSVGGLKEVVLKDITSEICKIELQILGMIGKLLTAQWMQKFYTSASTQINHVEGIAIVRDVVNSLKNVTGNPLDLLNAKEDFFGQTLDDSYSILSSLRKVPENKELFSLLMSDSIRAVIDVLERQYKKYFEMDLTQSLIEETKSACSHNMDSEEIMGMFSSAKER